MPDDRPPVCLTLAANAAVISALIELAQNLSKPFLFIVKTLRTRPTVIEAYLCAVALGMSRSEAALRVVLPEL